MTEEDEGGLIVSNNNNNVRCWSDSQSVTMTSMTVSGWRCCTWQCMRETGHKRPAESQGRELLCRFL